MELIRRFWSSRIAVGFVIAAFLFLICIWSLHINKFSFALGSIFLSPFILWSIYEVFSIQFSLFQRNNITIFSYVFFSYFLIIIPSFSVLFFSFDELFLHLEAWHFLIGIFIGSLIVFMFGFLFFIKRGRINTSLPSMLVIVFLFWNVVLFMVMYSQWHWLTILFVSSIMNDSFAYLFGRKWGKTCLSVYSPNKTKFGFICGWIFTCFIIGLYLWITPYAMKENLFGLEGVKNWWISIFFLIPGVLLGSIGDLYFSRYKRLFGVKDYSSFLGSHGGFWDRFDSHSFVFIFWTFCFLIWQTL